MSNSIIIRKKSGNSLTVIKSGTVSTTLAPATNTTLGGVIVGDNLTITGNGVLSTANGVYQPVIANTTYGLTDTPISTGYSNLYIRGERVTNGLENYYLGLRGEKESGSYLEPTHFALGSYATASNGTVTSTTSIETNGASIVLACSDSSSATQPYGQMLVGAGGVSLLGRIGSSQSIISVSGETISGSSAGGGNFELRGNLGGTGNNAQNYRLAVGPSSNFDRGIIFQHVSWKSTVGFNYGYTSASVAYAMSNGMVFDNQPGAGFAGSSTSLQHTSTATVTGVTTGTQIKVTPAKAELFYLGVTPVYTSDSILTRGYADTRYQAIGSYLTTTTASSTYSPIVHSHAISDVTGLQTALDGKQASGSYVLTSDSRLTDARTPLAHNQAWSTITGTPTTLSGYGITDGYSSTNPAGYITSACLTYSNITGTAYSLPTANTTVLGGVKVDGTSVTISNGTISVSTSYAGLGSNSFTGSQNLQDNELVRAKIRDYSETISSPTISAGTLTLNLETSNIFTVSLNAAITTLTISNPPASGSGGSFTLILTADGTARAVTWPASIKWAGGTAPTLTSTSGKLDSFAFFTSDGGTSWTGYVGGQNF